MNDTNIEISQEFLASHRKEFNKFKTDLDNLYTKNKNKIKIIALLDYWIFNILLLKKIYGSRGLLNFCNSHIKNPQRFSFFYELNNLNKVKEIRLKKNKSKFFYVLKFFANQIYVPGAHLDNFFKKILNYISLKFILSIPAEIDENIQHKLNNILESIFHDKFSTSEINLVLKKIPLVFISNLISMPLKKITVSGSPSSFLEYEGFENIFLLDSNLHIEGIQHGGGYDIFKIDYFADYEKALCDKFYGWGFSEENIHQTKFMKISNKTPSNIKRVLWIEDSKVPSFYFYSMPHHHQQSINIKSKEYIYKELNSNKIEYTSMFHPASKSNLYKNFRRNDFDVPMGGQSEKNFFLNDILIFDNSGSTLIHCAIENEMIFYQVISRLDYENFTELQKEFFLIQRKYNFGIFDDEESKLSNSISNIKSNDNYCLPNDLIEFYRKYFK